MAIKDTKIEKEEFEVEMVDITSADLMEGVEQEIDTKDDWQARACPPPAGKYRLKLTIQDEKFELGRKQGFDRNDSNGVFYKKTIQCKIQSDDPKIKDAIIDYKASTGIPRGKKMSTMAGLLAMCGFKLPAKMTDKGLALHFYKALSQKEPILGAECDWEVWDAHDKDNMKKLVSGMKNFPKNAKGEFNHIVITKFGEFVAKLKVMKWVKPTGVAVATPEVKPVAKKKVEEPVEDDGFETVSANAVDDDGEIIMD